MKSKIILSLLFLLTSTSAFSKDQKTESAKVEQLVESTSSWDGTPYKSYPSGQPDLRVIRMTIPANTALPWHTHPYPNTGYILKGQLTLEDRDSGKKITFNAGEAFPETVGGVHRGISGNTETVLILTYSGVKGVPTFKSEPGEVDEY
ncbi:MULTISPECIES: cupin domain-containing protein [Serratia]|jgi:quercetin dioxygenase-like cupin family protein|uniref:cupin domain-containing protein n=1 Tax=Serratia TaxID=613 RepID=UPI00223F5C23|nr:cupin domain-containing protein [Serratia grimesii]